MVVQRHRVDLIALDEEKQPATFIETNGVPQTNRIAKGFLQNLKIKAQHFDGSQKENYCIIAKHITDKNKLTNKGI